MSDNSHVCVVGAGAMGSLYGGRLALAGVDVTLVDPWRAHVDAIDRYGLILDDMDGQVVVPVRATVDPAQVAPAGLVIVFVDTNSTAGAALTASQVLAPGGSVLTLQNGIGNREALVAVLGDEAVMAGLSYASAAIVAPGRVAHTHAGPTWLGEADGARSERLDTLVAHLERARLQPVVVDDITALVWDKWILNCAINALCAITGLRQGEIPRTAALQTYQDRILDELFAVVAARDITLSDPTLRETIKTQCWKKFNKPSMLQHMEAGKRTEIDALNGAAVRLGRACGVATPFNEALALLIKGRERGREMEDLPEPDYAALEAEAAREARP